MTLPLNLRTLDGSAPTRVEIVAAYTAKHNELVAVDSSGGTVTVTIPEAPPRGFFVIVGDDAGAAGTFGITVTPAGGQTIDGAASYAIVDADAFFGFVFDGTEYKRIAAPEFLSSALAPSYQGPIVRLGMLGAAAGAAGTTLGTYANRPAAGADNEGERYIPTDGWCEFVCHNSEWRPMFAGHLGTQPPAAATWTQVDMGSPAASLVDDAGTVVFSAPSSGSGTLRRPTVVRATPAAPFTVSAGVNMHAFAVTYSGAGLVLRDSATGRYLAFQWFWDVSPAWYLMEFNGTTGAGSNQRVQTNWPEDLTHAPFYFHVHDPGGVGNLVWSYSKDGDFENSIIIHNTSARNAWLANIDQVGLELINQNTDARASVSLRLIDWTVQT